MKVFKLLLWLWLFFAMAALRGQTSVQGIVLDQNGEPIPYANIIFTGTKIGTFSKEDGSFVLTSAAVQKEIEVSFVGFVTQHIPLSKKVLTHLKVVLTEGELLQDIVLVSKPRKKLSKKENPAYKLLTHIWKNKGVNALQTAKAYEYRRNTAIELGLNKLDTVFLKRAVGGDYQHLIGLLGNKPLQENYSLPMYAHQTIEQVYAHTEAGLERTDITAERQSGVAQTGYGLERISRAFPNFDVYDGIINVLGKPFVSPLSESGYGVYAYVLSDSTATGQGKRYTVHFFPHKDQDRAFEGSFVVSSPTYAIEKIQMNTTVNTNINFIRWLYLQKEYEPIGEKWVLKSEVYEGDFTAISKSDNEKGIYLKKNIQYSHYVLNEPKDKAFYQQQAVKTKANQFAKSDEYWQELSENTGDNSIHTLVNQVKESKAIGLYTKTIDVLSSGYFRLSKYMQFGSIWEAVTMNSTEGTRLRGNVRTYITADDSFRSYAYVAYGTTDRKWKWGLSGQYLLLGKPHLKVGGLYRDDNMQLGSILMRDEANLRMQNPTAFWFERGENYYMVRNKLWQFMTDLGLAGSNLHFTLSGSYMHSSPAVPERFSISFNNEKGMLSTYTDAFVRFTTTYTPNRNVYGYGVEQRFEKYNRLFPVYIFRYTKGIEGIGGSAFNYHKLEGRVTYPLPIWNLGTLFPTIEMGKGFGQLPLTQLSPTPANQTYTTVPLTFMLLDYYDFINDTYINAYFEHHFEGFIFNRIPLLKHTKWRSVVFARTAYGSISAQNKLTNATNLVYNPVNSLYWEYGFGVENIGYGNFRFLRLDFVWSNRFNDVNGTTSPHFGLRVDLRPDF